MTYPILPLNLQQLWQDQSDRITRLELAYNGPQVSADAAQTTGNTALTDATTALANAAIAYTAAENSLQPSAYAIQDPTTKQLTSINATGLTVYTGSSPTSGARVVMNSVGLAGYNSSGVATFAITASTGAASFAGSITGSTITGSTLNIGGNFVVDGSGFLTCTGATITGTITATSGSFTGSLYSSGGTIGGFTISAAGFSSSGATVVINNSGTVSCGTVNIASGGLTSSGAINANGYLYNYGYATTTSSANAYINSSTGLLARSSSSLRYKLNVEPQIIPNQSILALAPKSFIDKASADAQGSTDGLPRILGLIAEEIAEIPVLADLLMNKNEEGQPDSVNYDRVAVALIPLLKDHEARLAKLEGANGTTTSN